MTDWKDWQDWTEWGTCSWLKKKLYAIGNIQNGGTTKRFFLEECSCWQGWYATIIKLITKIIRCKAMQT